MLSLGILHIWEVATWETVTWDVALGRMSLGKYLTPFKLSINLKNPVPDSQRYPFAQKYSYLCLKNCRFFKKSDVLIYAAVTRKKADRIYFASRKKHENIFKWNDLRNYDTPFFWRGLSFK